MGVVLKPVQEGNLEVRGPKKKEGHTYHVLSRNEGVLSNYSEDRFTRLFQDK